MLSDGWKSAFEMASEDPKKILLKSRKTRNCLTFLAISKALTIHPTNFLRQIFNTSFQTVRAKKLKLCKNFTLFITRAFPEFVWHGRKGPTLKGKRLRSVKSVKQFLVKKKKIIHNLSNLTFRLSLHKHAVHICLWRKKLKFSLCVSLFGIKITCLRVNFCAVYTWDPQYIYRFWLKGTGETKFIKSIIAI